jgi:hypothetical protein
MTHDDLMKAAMSGRRLAGSDIKTMKDLDLYRYQQLFTKGGKPKRNVTSIKSRYGTLVDLYGQRQANKIMRELEVKAWDLPGTK